MKRVLAVLCFCIISLLGISQNEDEPKAEKGFLIGVNANVLLPGGDLSKRFGIAQSYGPYVGYKTGNNWTIAINSGLIFGNTIKEDSLLKPIETHDGKLIGIDGFFSQVNLFQRGYFLKGEINKTFPINDNLNSGITVGVGAGFLQHKIKIIDRDRLLPSLFGDYLKGYDRLTNGILTSQYIGYNYYGQSSFINFYAGFEFTQGFTQNRRSYNFNTKSADTTERLDLMYAIKVGWVIPIFNNVGESKKYYY